MSGLFSWLTGGRTKPQTKIHPTNGEPEAALEAKGLLKGFGQGETRSIAVANVSLKLYRGEIALLMGPSGSGKSTLLAMISGLLRPDEGEALALGEDIWQYSTVQMERFRLAHCSYIFQGCNLFPALTARQQLELVLKWGEGASSSEARERATRMLTQLGLAKKTHLRPAALSGGEKQRVAIARALVKEPSFLFADEPTSALDWENGQQVIELLNKAAHERGAMVLVVTHDSRLIQYADRVYHMEDGRLVSAEGGPGSTKTHAMEMEDEARQVIPMPQPVVVAPTAPLTPTAVQQPAFSPTFSFVDQAPVRRVNLGNFLQDSAAS